MVRNATGAIGCLIAKFPPPDPDRDCTVLVPPRDPAHDAIIDNRHLGSGQAQVPQCGGEQGWLVTWCELSRRKEPRHAGFLEDATTPFNVTVAHKGNNREAVFLG